MATATKAIESGPKPYRFDVRQYLAMIESGVIPAGARLELLDGIPVEQMTKYPPHNFTVGRLGVRLRQTLPDAWLVREEKSLELGRFWRPEPDLAIVRGPDNHYQARDPRAADIGLLVEVADSSYLTDRGLKWRRYAEARVKSYWIVSLGDRTVEVYSIPAGRGRSASYRSASIFLESDMVPIVLDGQEIGQIAVAGLLAEA